MSSSFFFCLVGQSTVENRTTVTEASVRLRKPKPTLWRSDLLRFVIGSSNLVYWDYCCRLLSYQLIISVGACFNFFFGTYCLQALIYYQALAYLLVLPQWISILVINATQQIESKGFSRTVVCTNKSMLHSTAARYQVHFIIFINGTCSSYSIHILSNI